MSAPSADLLIVDDQDYVRESLAAVLGRRGHRVRAAATAEAALDLLASSPADVLVTDLQMPGADGLALLERLARVAPGVPAIVLTGHGTVASAVACMKAGAFDYLEKPAEPDALVLAVERALEWVLAHRELEIRRRTDEPEDAPVGVSASWRAVMDLAVAASRVDSTVLLLGESGSGKEVLAREIHRRSARAASPFVPVNCAAIPAELFESEFFGHVRGAFTGATADRTGRFALAHRGTLFLDEVGCLSAGAQAKLLRVLQDGAFERVGDSRALHADVRVVAATNADVDAEARAGRFRRDLLYRLDVVRIAVPPLRERREDIALLVARWLPRCAQRAGRSVRGVTPAALRILTGYDWPGNVRELQNVLERAVVLEPTDELTPASLPLATGGVSLGMGGLPLGTGGLSGGSAAAPGDLGDDGDLRLREAARRAERRVLVEALRRSGNVRSQAARLLGIDPRNLSYYLRKHGLGEPPEA